MPAPRSEPPETPRGTESRARIVEAALALFEERGYEATTMRAVAERAGVSLGNAYYYFASKEHLLQAFYARAHEEHVELARPVLAREKTLVARLKGVLRVKLENEERYHRFAGILFRTAADPASPLNPFSEASRPVREASTALFREVLEGAKVRIPKDLRARLPELLWTWQMGIVLFWIHDRSPRRERTQRLVDSGTDLVVRLISLASNPLLAPLRRQALRMLEELGPFGAPAPDGPR